MLTVLQFCMQKYVVFNIPSTLCLNNFTLFYSRKSEKYNWIVFYNFILVNYSCKAQSCISDQKVSNHDCMQA